MFNSIIKKIPKFIKVLILVLVILFCLIFGYLRLLRVLMLNDIVVSWLNSDIIEANYFFEKNFSYVGFLPKLNYGICEDHEPPIVNISTDGKNIAIFAASCNNHRYYCVDSKTKVVTNKAVISKEYIESGSVDCGLVK